MKLTKGTVVALEGLDATGKSTQLKVLEELFPSSLCIHSPSGKTDLGAAIYAITEREHGLVPLTRQFLHLASHAEMYEREIVPALKHGSVIMDRNWWSTIAYGYFGTGMMYQGHVDVTTFMQTARLPTQGVHSSVTFLFLEPVAEDFHNTPQVLSGYQWLRDHTHELVVPIPLGSVDDTTVLILAWLRDQELAVG